jgi:hypothetical protein
MSNVAQFRDQMPTRPIDYQRLPSLMKFHDSRRVLLALFALAAMGSASATQMNTSTYAGAPQVAIVESSVKAAGNPWPSLASVASEQPATLLAHDDRRWHEGPRHDRRDEWRREQWRKDQWRREQARREAERRRYWERHHDRRMSHHREDSHRYYRR